MGTVPIWSFLAGFHTQKLWCLSSRGFACSESKELPVGSVGLAHEEAIPDSFLCPRCSGSAFLLPSSWLWDTFLAVEIINHQLLCRLGRMSLP